MEQIENMLKTQKSYEKNEKTLGNNGKCYEKHWKHGKLKIKKWKHGKLWKK